MKGQRDYGIDKWCPFYVGETVYSRYLVGDWRVAEIGMGSVRLLNIGHAVQVEIDPQHLNMYPAEELLDA
jgi:hypothetical protein